MARKKKKAKAAAKKPGHAKKRATTLKRAAAKAAAKKIPAKKAAAKKAPARKKQAPPRTAASEAARLARNKQLVLALYQKLIGEKDFEAARHYMGDSYRQHAPYAADGHEGVRAWLEGFKAAFPNHRYEVKKVLAEGDMVVLHLHGMNGPNPHGESVVDFFRIENGKVVEHWDVIQPIPDSADNANSMF